MSTQMVADKTNGQIAAEKAAADTEFRQAVNDEFKERVVNAGLLSSNGKLNLAEVIERTFNELRTKQVVQMDHSRDDRSDPATSSSKEELTAAVFTAGPTAAEAKQDAVMAKVYDKCKTTVWNITQPGKPGKVQDKLRAEKLLIVRGDVFRLGNTIAEGIYVTVNSEAVVRDYMKPPLLKMRELASAIEAEYKLATDIDPELGEPLRAEIEKALIEVTAKLPVTTLTVGQQDGQKAIDKQ